MFVYGVQVDFEDLCAHNKELLLHLTSLAVKKETSIEKASVNIVSCMVGEMSRLINTFSEIDIIEPS